MAKVDLERLLSRLGFGTRKECRAMVRARRVSISGILTDDPFLVLETLPATLSVDGKDISTETDLYLMLHKPAGTECSHRATSHPSVFSLFPERFLSMEISSVGRLDVDTTGLLLISNDGAFVHHVESPRKGIGKVYKAVLERPLSDEAQEQLLAGIPLRNEKGTYKALQLECESECVFRITIGEGIYHQVKRMFAAVGSPVVSLHREAIGELRLDPTLAPGQWRVLDDVERHLLGYTSKGK